MAAGEVGHGEDGCLGVSVKTNNYDYCVYIQATHIYSHKGHIATQ